MHRVVEISWRPSSAAQWQAFTASRLEAARLWNALVRLHARIRRLSMHLTTTRGMGMKWPSAKRWEAWRKKRRFVGLSAQSTQRLIAEFLSAVDSTRRARKAGVSTEAARYPWRTTKYHDVVYTNQDARVRNGILLLPNGNSGTLRIKLPRELPGKLMEVRLSFGAVRLVCKLPELLTMDVLSVLGIDLGVNTLIAATDGERAILVSGREAKATVQWRNKRLAELSAAQSRLTKHSRRWRRLQRRKHRVLDKARNRIRDVMHKATRIVADAFPTALAVVGKPFNDAARKMGRRQAQQVSQACNAKIIALLAYKLAGGVEEVDEHYTSQTCPVCVERRRVGRIYRCGCGFEAPRDVVGATNIRSIGLRGGMVPRADVPGRLVRALPHRKYPGHAQVVPGDPRHVARSVA